MSSSDPAAYRTFLTRGRPVFSQERGLTPRARMLLDSLAQELGLSSDDFERGLAALQRGEGSGAAAESPQVAHFREYLTFELSEIVSGILNVRLERRLTELGMKQFELDEAAAREAVHGAAQQRGLRRIPLDEALRYLDQIVEQKLGDATSLAPEDLARLHETARDWGLEADDLQRMISYRLEENTQRSVRERTWARSAIVTSITAVVGAIGAFAYLFFQTAESPLFAPQETAKEERPAEEPAKKTEPEIGPRSNPAWWNETITEAISATRREHARCEPIFDAIASADAHRRGEGYELLFDRGLAEPFDPRAWSSLAPIAQEAFVLEVDEVAAQTLQRRWLRCVNETVRKLPPSPADYDRPFQALAALANLACEERLPPQRGETLRKSLETVLRTTLPSEATSDETERACLGAFACLLLSRAVDELPDRRDLLPGHHAAIAAWGRTAADPTLWSSFESRLAAAAVRNTVTPWRSWERLIVRASETDEIVALRALAEALGECRDESLRVFLGTLLAQRAGLSPQAVNESGFLDRLRREFGGVSVASQEDVAPLRVKWIERVEPLLKRNVPRNLDDLAALARTLEVAKTFNLGLTLVREPSAERFSSAERAEDFQEAESETSVDSRVTLRVSRLSSVQQDTFEKYLADLARSEEIEVPKRASYVRAVSQLADRVPDLTYAQAAGLAKYILLEKEEDEHIIVREALRKMRAWKQLRLAVADSLQSASLEPEQLRETMILLAGVELGDSAADRAALRTLLKKTVASEAEAEAGAAGISLEKRKLDEASERLSACYLRRAERLGVPLAERREARSPSDALALSLRSSFFASPAAKFDPLDDRARYAAIADVTRESDARRAIVLQRGLIAALARTAKESRPKRHDDIERELLALGRRDREAKRPLEQLLEGELTLLRILRFAIE